ncbi:DUF4387 domain-containing protein [Natranaerofaba carboxydovora]|uniref:DUF4387 domain-containing protein n=1 Tax=Natranaerofaba carboxydovora TaxID=2742683 RepID=UPI001F14246D|nr:DUF4387 domain-containing protein [Natranaerofaba carboxydovora]UMZ74181.1 hypothetical protein ACONDI_01761 [Natranaerofaba carboxydovora]
MSEAKLRDVAKVIRSKNAGPYQLTFDIIFNSKEDLEKVKRGKSLTPGLVANLYGFSEDKVLGIHFYPPADAIKITVLREVSSGGVNDTDVYGAQQHAPLLDAKVKLA